MSETNEQKRPHQLVPTRNGKTEQHHMKRCDIKNIMKGYRKNGLITHVNKDLDSVDPAQNFINADDFQTQQNKVAEVKSYFATLPAHYRSKFDNRPEKMLEFLGDENNKLEAAKMGLLDVSPEEVKTLEEKAAPAVETQAPAVETTEKTAVENTADQPAT